VYHLSCPRKRESTASRERQGLGCDALACMYDSWWLGNLLQWAVKGKVASIE
jgi:hypothetical protein